MGGRVTITTKHGICYMNLLHLEAVRVKYILEQTHIYILQKTVGEGEHEPPNLVTRVKTCRNSSQCKKGITTNNFKFILPNHDRNEPQYFTCITRFQGKV
jgi:hypothetical protein